MNDKRDEEQNRLSARAARYMRVGTNVGAVAARVASQRLFGLDADDTKNAAALAAALGGLKGPIMKVAQLMATIPEVLPPESRGWPRCNRRPDMGTAFVRRSMVAEIGPEGGTVPALGPAGGLASLARCTARCAHGRCRSQAQYPPCSRPGSDLNQLKIFALALGMTRNDKGEMLKEIAARRARSRVRLE